MLAERRSFKPDDRVEAMSKACYNKRRNTLENPTSRIPTHNGRENERDEGMSRQGEKKETKTTNGNIPNVVVNDDNSGGERGKEGGERRGQSLLAMMERISVPFFFSYKHPFCVSVVVLFLADEKGKEKRPRKRNEPGTTHASTFYSFNQHCNLSTG
jgi:hypothetical protein